MPERDRGERGEKGEKGEPGRDADPGLRGAVHMIFRSIGVGAGGGTLAGIVVMVTDPHGSNARAAGAIGVALGGLNGLSEVVIRHLRAKREADAEPNRLARIEAERKLKGCQAENAELRRQVDEHSTRIKQLEIRETMNHAEMQKLTAYVVELSKKLAELDA